MRSNDPQDWVFEHSKAKEGMLLGLVALAHCVDYRRCIACVPVSRLMKMTRLSRRHVFYILQMLQDGTRKQPGLREIERVGSDTQSGATIFHFRKFCEMGSCKGVLWTALSCPHVVGLQRLRKGMPQTAYIKEREEQPVREPGLRASVSREIFTRRRGTNGREKLRGQALFEHNLAVAATAGRHPE